ncbi:hypothetical protein AYO21_00608 [Fonsecaea monophora]|uniref:Enoyl reductase (ER) domain-containing protein n=1 Tax=Fonsecaea monophora TaxID=254056 RepID=A0A177FNU7_9EURO|nr:hypothetical protein AYO21_00608 [Fonsecaea monophora]OAG45260.1 hypothetical protein AYO21_00608 [Fonsecaea monophora]
MSNRTMRAVVFKGPFEVAVEDRPVPTLQDPTDVILKVTATALCGSDLHYYRGHVNIPPGLICGHEFVGSIVEKGEDVKSFEIGERAVVPFSTACSQCFYCTRSLSGRCTKGQMFGMPGGVPGGQAEYVRVPLADTTLFKSPDGVDENLLVLMADIFPTGYFAASRFLSDLRPDEREDFTAVIIGCGPVGICAIATALTMVKTVYAIDSVPERLAEAEKIGAIALALDDQPADKIRAATGGRGADVVVEVVGRSDALMLGLDIVRPYGKISSIGVHTATLEIPGLLLYGKAATLAFGRCPVSSVFKSALDVLIRQQEKVAFLCGRKMPLEEAPQAWKDFEARKVHKVVFDLTQNPSSEEPV